jgi:ribulose-phosphate 3-epimerase
MATVIPAILGETFTEVKEKLEKVTGLVDWVQIDIADGIFATPETWSRPLDLWEPLNLPKIELHLMVQNPHSYLRDWLPASVDRIMLHAESEGDMKENLKKIKETGLMVGLVLKLETPIEKIEPFIKEIDVIQFMSIAQIGSYGELFDEKVLEKIRQLRGRYPNVTISVDGGVTLEMGKKAIEAGASQLVVGSGIFKSENISQSILDFQKI